MRLGAGNFHVLHFQGHLVAQPRLLWSEKWCQKWWLHRELLGIGKTVFGESQSSSVSAFCLPVPPEQWGRDWFWRSAPTYSFLGDEEDSHFRYEDTEEKEAVLSQVGNSASPCGWASSRRSLQAESLAKGGIGLLPCFLYGVREFIEILVYPSFGLTPRHMVLSLVSYFSFLFAFFKFLFLGDKTSHLNKVLS